MTPNSTKPGRARCTQTFRGWPAVKIHPSGRSRRTSAIVVAIVVAIVASTAGIPEANSAKKPTKNPKKTTNAGGFADLSCFNLALPPINST